MGLEITDGEEMDTSDLFNEMQELLSSCKSARARVNQLPCSCTKGKGPTRKSRRFCNQCEALHSLGNMRRKLEELKERFRES